MEEPSWILRAVTYHFGSGDALVVGLLFLMLAAQGNCWNWSRSRVALFAVLGWVWIALASWPVLILQVALIVASVYWFVRCVLLSPTAATKSFLRTALGLWILTVLLCAFRESRGFTFAQPAGVEVAVIGDSITAGLNDGDDTWPRQLARRCDVVVRDASQQGATVKSAHEQWIALERCGGVLILEIGGNDLLEGYPVDRFADDLEVLLRDAATAAQSIVMFELPLPPLSNAYGYHQRRLARQYGVRLIPKRELVDILTTAGSTVDGIHLSDLGQSRLADCVKRILQLSQTSNDDSRYHRVERRSL
ncbi:MAG: hypothetical protein B7Z55_04105 [Planctomycetales bacterium 12-60-4]|nr:MAG: hypothetical protein B7Z55_04105 [Planctomycetales bacterium 12-60-4]